MLECRGMQVLRWFVTFGVIGATILTAGCGSQLLPDAGPNALAVKSEVTWNGPP